MSHVVCGNNTQQQHTHYVCKFSTCLTNILKSLSKCSLLKQCTWRVFLQNHSDHRNRNQNDQNTNQSNAVSRTEGRGTGGKTVTLVTKDEGGQDGVEETDSMMVGMCVTR